MALEPVIEVTKLNLNQEGNMLTQGCLHFLGKEWEIVALVMAWTALTLLEVIFSLLRGILSLFIFWKLGF